MHKNKFIFVLYFQLNLPVRQSVLGSWINLQGKTLIRTDGQQERSKFVWLQALCNAAMALGLSLLYLLDHGSDDLPVVFRWVSDIQTLYSAAVSPSTGTTTAAASWAWRCWGRSPDLDQAFVKVCITLLYWVTLRQPNIM